MTFCFYQARAKADLREFATVEDAEDVIEIFEHCVGDKSRLTATTSTSRSTQPALPKTPAARAKLLLHEIMRSSRESHKTIFSMDELKLCAKRVKIFYDVANLIDILNVQGFMLKKSALVYQLIDRM